MNLIDTHAHLCDPQFEADRAEVLSRAGSSGVETMVEIADDPQQWGSAAELARNPNVYWTCGFHPHYAANGSGFNFDLMKESASLEKCVAVGEIGLDYVKSGAAKEDQIALFRKTLEISAELNKPVVVHCREAQADTLRILKSFYSGLSRRDLVIGVIHCFSGDLSFAEGCMDLGFFLGVDGPITYPSAKGLREVISKVPLDKIVLETDSPYLPPQNFRGKRNEPAHLVWVCEKLSELFEVSAEELARTTTENAKKLYRLKI